MHIMKRRSYAAEKRTSLPFVHAMMLISAFLVSTSFTVSHTLAPRLDPLALTFSRFVIASLSLTPYIVTVHGFSFSVSLFLRCGVISGCLVSFFWTMFYSLRFTTALNISVIFTLVPSIAGIYAYLLLRERMTTKGFLALLCGLVGALWVIFDGNLQTLLHMHWNKGDLIFFLGCLGMGLYTVLVRYLYRGEPMIVMTYWILVTGCCWLAMFGWRNLLQVAWLQLPAGVLGGTAYLAIFCTVCTFFLTQYAILHIGPTRVMAYSYLYPAMVLIIDYALGHGLPELRVLPGILVVIGAMVLILREKR